MKVDAAKCARVANKKVTKRVGFRDHRHRSEKAQLEFGVKGKEAYHRIGKPKGIQVRDALITEQSTKFKNWISIVLFTYWSAT